MKNPNNPKEKFWALLIEPEWITSAIWQISDGKVEVISTSPSTRWDPSNENVSDLIEAIDTTLSACTQNLPEDFPDPTKTVFGVPNSWLEDGKIKEENLLKLKKICEDLSLVPSGFVVLAEAISHFIKQEEESPLFGIVIGVSSESLDLSIFNSGKLVGTTNVFRSATIEEDVIEGITRLASDQIQLPPRIILFNEKIEELEDVKTSLDNTNWDRISLPSEPDKSKFTHTPKIEILDPSKKILAVALAGGSEMGGITGFAEVAKEEEIVETSNVEVPEGVTAEDLGFTTVTTTPKEPLAPKIGKVIAGLPRFKKPNLKFNFKFGATKPLIMATVSLLTILITGFLFWWIVPSATVSIAVTPKKLDENITLDLNSNFKNEEVEVTVSGEKTIPTTGTKTVGEKASGSVKVQNGTAFPINLATGTILISSSDLKFVTSKTASVSGALSPSSPGIATIDVVASNIGSEFNLSKDEVFKVGNYPKAEVDATSVDSFSGGSSRQISSVSEADRKNLVDTLKSELIEKAKEELSNKVTSDGMLIDATLKEEVTEEVFSNKVGDEATNLKLSLTLLIKVTSVSKESLFEVSKANLEGKIPNGFVLRDDQIKYEFKESDEDNKLDLSLTVNLLPSIDTTNVAKQIAGKYPTIAENFLASIPGFVNAEIRIIPSLKGKLGTLPHLYKKIEVIIVAEKGDSAPL